MGPRLGWSHHANSTPNTLFFCLDPRSYPTARNHVRPTPNKLYHAKLVRTGVRGTTIAEGICRLITTDTVYIRWHSMETYWYGGILGTVSIQRIERGTGLCIKSVPPRMIIFGWLAIRNQILTHDNLKKKGCIIISRCTLCKEAAESVYHLFYICHYTREVYKRLTLRQPSTNWPARSVLNVTDKELVGILTAGQKTLLLVMYFIVWRERCARSFKE